MKSQSLREYYQQLFKTHGISPKSVQYPDTASQQVRFEVLSSVDQLPFSVLDVGCGLADFLIYLQNEQQFKAKYCGVDFVEEFIQSNQERLGSETILFEVADLLKDTLPQGFDYVFASGIFNNIMEDNTTFFYQTIDKMFAAAEKGIAFNALSTYVDFQDESLFYINPVEAFDYIKKHHTRKVTLKHDYLTKPGSIPYEFTIFAYKE
tara:strand:- start:7369 stop:7989 length:621 start_codon:yes stop_codon:yes gene_type:complete